MPAPPVSSHGSGNWRAAFTAPREQAWREPGPGSPAGTEELRQTIIQLEQRNIELAQALEDRQAELDAARATNRDLTRVLNRRG
ncbi:hypothetical protein ACWDE0_22645 [Streptomyces sp. 900105755]